MSSAAYGQVLPRRIWLFDGQRCFSATLQMYPDRRLLDFLNDAVKTGRPFLPLTNVEIQVMVSSWVESRAESMSLSADHVWLASEAAFAFPGSLFQDKRPIPVRLTLQNGLNLNGTLYCAPAEQMTDVLNHTIAFLPLTDVSVIEGQIGGVRQWSFLAIKRETIVEATQLPAEAESS